MEQWNDDERVRAQLVRAIAAREGSPKSLASMYGLSLQEWKQFLKDNEADIKHIRIQLDQAREESEPDVDPGELDSLWISKKYERLKRYEDIANELYQGLKFARRDMSDGEFSTHLRELRFYMGAAANELGQLLHRGAGESTADSMKVAFGGIDLDGLK